MIFKQFYLPCLAHASYLIGDEATGTAAVVDPQRDIDQYIAFAAEHALKIKHVFLTHLHADFVAGHLELRDRVGRDDLSRRRGQSGLRVYSSSRWRHLEFGRVRLKVLETPGHTPESISILVYDLNASDYATACRAHRRHFVHRRRRASRSARGAGLVGRRTGRHALRFAAHQAAGAAGPKPGVSGSRRGLALREGAQQGNSFHAGRAAPLELRAAAHEQGSVHRGGDRRSAGSAGLLHLRCRAEQPGAAYARRKRWRA